MVMNVTKDDGDSKGSKGGSRGSKGSQGSLRGGASGMDDSKLGSQGQRDSKGSQSRGSILNLHITVLFSLTANFRSKRMC